MGLAKLRPKISVAEYLEGEKTAVERHEFVDGEVYAMSGASKRHNRIVRTLLDKFDSELEDGCEVFFTDVKVRIAHLNRFYYPDLAVVCADDDEDEYFITRPVLIIEVLSPSTALTDKREKWFAYQEIESLKEYVMIDQETGAAEAYRRREDGLWEFAEYFGGETFRFESVNVEVSIANSIA